MNQQLALSFDDRARLGKQLRKVRDYFEANRGRWLTLAEISAATGAPEASASARFRDLKALGFDMERKPGVGGLHFYRMSTSTERVEENATFKHEERA